MSLKEAGSSLYKLSDVGAVPDSYHSEDYQVSFRGKETALVIDNGSCTCKAGWAGEDSPRLVFRNAVARTRGKKGEADCVAIGNDITHVEAVRSTLKNQFDRNVVVNFSYQEQVLDYTFSHLGLGDDPCITHPLVVTEPACNPVHSRSQMSELLFECYGVPSVAYGIDALFSAHQNFGITPATDALIISSGHQTTHILPVLNGRLDSANCKRVNLGGMQTTGYLQRLLQMKYPDLQAQITLSCAREILHHHGYMALDYREELKSWAPPTGLKDYRTIQLPYNQSGAGAVVVADVVKEAKDRQRRERARQQLLKLNKQKREDKIAHLLKELNQHMTLQAQQESCDFEEYLVLLEEAGHESEESLACVVQQLESQLEVEQDKLATLIKNMSADACQRKKEPQELVTEEWLQSLKERRKELLECKRRRGLKRVELGKRRSAASQNRMRIISSLGAEVAVKKGKSSEDTFGMDDSDWNVYRTIDKHAEDSDSEKEEMELGEIVKVLEKHDPSYMRCSSLSNSSSSDMATLYQLALGVERFRAPEITFQPPMVGVDQSGLSETLEFVLQCYSPDTQHRLVQNVFVTGGNTLHEHFSQRLEVDIRCMRPFQSSFHLGGARDPLLDAWRGASKWAPSNSHCFLTKQEYLEKGSEFLKQHSMANISLT